MDYVPQHEYDRIAKRLVILPGDVLLSCSGSVGRSAVVPEGLLFTLVRSVAVLKPLAGMGRYLSTALRSPLLKQQILAKQTQTAQANIFQGKIKVLCVPIPPPLKWSGVLVPKREAVRKFVLVQKMQLAHINGLTYDFLYGMAKELEEKDSFLLLGAGPKSNQPLVLRRGASSFRGFLEGRTKGDTYRLILHLSNLELKVPEEQAPEEAGE